MLVFWVRSLFVLALSVVFDRVSAGCLHLFHASFELGFLISPFFDFMCVLYFRQLVGFGFSHSPRFGRGTLLPFPADELFRRICKEFQEIRHPTP